MGQCWMAVDLAELAVRLEGRVVHHLDADGSHDIGHLRRVLALAMDIAAEEGGDHEILTAAAYLHDLVNLPKDAPDRDQASRRSAEAARPILRELGVTPAKHDAIAHAIAAHSYSGAIAPQSLEARILQDADRLDALGAIGIARCFYVSGRMGAALFDPEDPLAVGRPRNDKRYALDHFETKLYPVAEALLTPTAQRIGAEKVARMKRFVTDLVAEAGVATGPAGPENRRNG